MHRADKENCLFIYFNIHNGYLSGAEYQLECGYIRAYLKRKGYITRQYISHEKNLNDMVFELDRIQAEYFVFYVNEYNYSITKLMVGKINCSRKRIVLLGPSAKYIAENLSDDLQFDIAVAAHSHMAMESILKKDDLTEIYNIYYRKDNLYVKNQEKSYCYTLDEIGLPYSEGLVPPEEVFHVGLISSKGCIGNCCFCSYTNQSKEHYMFSIGSVLKELDYIAEYVSDEKKQIYFFDDCFSMNSGRSVQLLQAIRDRQYPFSFWCCTRADILDHEVIELLQQCGFQQVVNGLETASEHVMEQIGKTGTGYTAQQYIDKVTEVFQYAKKMSIHPILSINFGMPDEMQQDAEITIRHILESYRHSDVSICFMTCFPGSRVFEDSRRYAVVKKESETMLPFKTFYKNYDIGRVFERLYDSGIADKSEDAFVDSLLFCFTEVMTGLYKAASQDNTIETVIADQLKDDTMQFIDRVVQSNGKVLLFHDTILLNKEMFCDDRKRLKIGFPEYEQYVKTAYEKNNYLPNICFVKEIADRYMIQYNNLYFRNMPVKTIKKIRSIEDLYYFAAKAEKFKQDRFVTMQDLDALDVENICRYTGVCHVNELKCVSIKEGKIYHKCGNIPIGSLKDDYAALLKKTVEIYKNQYDKRKCGLCSVNKLCTKCVYFENSYCSEEEYCAFMKQNAYMLRYLKMLAAIRRCFHAPSTDSTVMQAYLFMGNEEFADTVCFSEDYFILQYKDTLYLLSFNESMIIKLTHAESRTLKLYLSGRGDEKRKYFITSFVKKGLLIV